MDEQPFHLRGYPESDREKLVLITIPRLIERQTFEVGVGPLRSSFQELRRIEDEMGAREVFRQNWFVVFDPPADGIEPIALVAHEVEPRTWRGSGHDPDRVQRITRYVERTL